MKKKILIGLVLIIGLFLTITIILTATSPSPSPTPKAQESPAMQQERLAWIQKAIDMGVFYKIDYDDSVWVKPLFYSLSFDDKQTSISVVYTYYKATNPKLIAVHVKDYQTNKTIGTFTDWGGLKLD